MPASSEQEQLGLEGLLFFSDAVFAIAVIGENRTTGIFYAIVMALVGLLNAAV